MSLKADVWKRKTSAITSRIEGERMTLAEKQQQLIERFAVIHDPHERLSAVAAFKPALASLAETERIDTNLVRGCSSAVWLVCSVENGRCQFRFHADSPMVRGLVGVLCRLYDDMTPQEIVVTEPQVFEALGIAKNLSPTRLNGLAAVRSAIRDFASRALNP